MPVTTAYKVEGGIRTARLDSETLDFRKYRKTALAEAVQIPHAFAVETLEGVMDGAPGDYLMRGAAAELYPCAKDIFESTYEPADGKPDSPEVIIKRVIEGHHPEVDWEVQNHAERGQRSAVFWIPNPFDHGTRIAANPVLERGLSPEDIESLVHLSVAAIYKQATSRAQVILGAGSDVLVDSDAKIEVGA